MKNRKILPLILFVFLVGGFIFTQFSSTKKQVSVVKEAAKVIRVVDGDTIKVLIQDKEDTVRLIGIDSPEVVDDRKPSQCFGKEASDKAKEILTDKTITLESDLTQGNRDEYGRLLRYVFLNNLNINKIMLSEGYAREYTFKGNSYKYQSDFIQAEKKAMENEMGLWLRCP